MKLHANFRCVRCVCNYKPREACQRFNCFRPSRLAGIAKSNKIVSSLRVRLAEVRPAEVRLEEVRRDQVRLCEGRPAEVRPAEVRPAEVRPVEVRPVEVRPAEVRTGATVFRVFTPRVPGIHPLLKQSDVIVVRNASSSTRRLTARHHLARLAR